MTVPFVTVKLDGLKVKFVIATVFVAVFVFDVGALLPYGLVDPLLHPTKVNNTAMVSVMTFPMDLCIMYESP